MGHAGLHRTLRLSTAIQTRPLLPAARQSLHLQGKAADFRVPRLSAEVLGGLVKSFRTGGVGFYYRSGPSGGWIHTDTGLQRSWKG